MSQITDRNTLIQERTMNDEMLNLGLTDSGGQEKPLQEWLRDSPFTGLLTYRGDW